MSKKRGKRQGLSVRSKNGRVVKQAKKSGVAVATAKVHRGRPMRRIPAHALDETPSPSESQDAAPSIQEVAMERDSEPVPEPHICPNCDGFNTASHMERDEFGYGVAPNTVVLAADVLVFECFECKQRWTGEQAEGARAAAVESYLAQKKAAEDGEVFL